MHYQIKNDKVYDYSDVKYAESCLYSDLCNKEEYQAYPGKYIIGDIEEEVPVYDDEGNITGYETITVKGLVLNPNYEQEEAARREAEFNKAFFNTSLGYIRRAVTMADGSKKDFLSDLLPVISLGVQEGQTVTVLAYDKPPFTEDVTDWTEYQHAATVTAQFISECFNQLSNDFLPQG